MKSKKNMITLSIIILVIGAITLRLIYNRQSLAKELKSVSEFNTEVPVAVDTISGKNIPGSFSVNGSFSPLSEVSVVSETQGKVEAIFAGTGSSVKAGQILASTDRELITAQLSAAKGTYEQAEKDLKRFELLSRDDAASLKQFEAAKLSYLNAQSAYVTAKKQYDNLSVKAPVSGIITKRYIEKGSFLSPGTTAFDIVDIRRVIFIARLTAEQLSDIRQNEQIKLKADVLPGREFRGRVSSIGIKADQSRRYDVEIEVVNSSQAIDKIIPGMFGTAFFENDLKINQLVIKRRTLIRGIKDPAVFVVNGDRVREKNIVIEPLNDEYLHVKNGLRQGDIVVTSGQINLTDGSKIKVMH
ncbi:MAG: efflux RND transporter periplasmic adaptor subunit [Ignavibacteria bacterium]|jgi:RND family efflux transporter MFP subunit|nr:efflux RND transporter periplasmic adaptor subunit [Ignavibacteria bacterium]MCU7517006.1 efflux RND transporter periplasmic adaptor subunit [Ignavibacteria bacterium]